MQCLNRFCLKPDPRALGLAVGVFALLASLWVLVSHRLITVLIQHFGLDYRFELLEGPLFVALSSGCMYLIVKNLNYTQTADAGPAGLTCPGIRPVRILRKGARPRVADAPDLLLEREALREAAGVARIVAWRMDPQSGRLTLVAGAALEVLGVSGPALLRQEVLLADLLEAPDRQAWFVGRRQALAGTEGRFEAGLHHRVEDRRLWTRWTVQLRAGQLWGTIQDCTAAHDLEERLHQSRKLEFLGTFLGGITHDFNNILSSIQGYNEMLLMDPALTPLQRRSLEVMHRGGERGRSLASHLLRYLHKDPPERRMANLNDLVREVQALLEAPGPNRVTLALELDPSLPDLAMDATQIHQVLMNLAVNARDALSGEGRICCRTQALHLSDPEIQGQAGSKVYILVEVVDTGMGIPPEIQERIFEPFYTTKGAGKGSGLGLSLVQGIVKAHGGTIRCFSTVGKGTLFQILLPVPEVAGPPERTPARAVTAGLGRATEKFSRKPEPCS